MSWLAMFQLQIKLIKYFKCININQSTLFNYSLLFTCKSKNKFKNKMSFYSWIFGGDDTELIQQITTIEQMVASHQEKKTELEELELKLLKLKADLETLGIAINNRLESNRITYTNSDTLLIPQKATAQPMFY
jgi:hypothetical protein